MRSLQYRKAVPGDSAECIVLRGRTRQNSVSAGRLASLGITAESWGFTGEVVVLAVLPEFEGQGIGKTLLSKVVQDLRLEAMNVCSLAVHVTQGHGPLGSTDISGGGPPTPLMRAETRF